MAKKYTDLFIDFDDTIYDTHGNAQLSLVELFNHFELGKYFERVEDFTVPYWKTNGELWAQYSRGEITRDYLIVERFKRPLSLGKNLNPTREYCLEVSDKFLDLCSCKPGLVNGARQLLDYLQGKFKLHLCSNGFHEVQYRKLNASDTARYFDTVILSEDAGANKPSGAFFEYAFRISGADKAATLMIGDNPETDIRGAIQAGIDTLYFNPDHKEVTVDATYTVNTLEEIIKLLEN